MIRHPQKPNVSRDAADKAYIRYLTAKKSVDDRALNRHVWQMLKTGLPPATPRTPLWIIEMGAGIGTMFERVLEWGLASHVNYTMVEVNPAFLADFQARTAEQPFHSHGPGPPREDSHGTVVETICADLYDVVSDRRQYDRWDLIMAHAVMDLVDAAEVLAGMARLVKPGGLLYLSLIYDGWTEFLPQDDLNFERYLFERYHRSMQNRVHRGRPAGTTSRSAAAMFAHLTALHLPILAAGASDWIVFPRRRDYMEDEAYFLVMIIDTILRQLRQDNTIDQERLTAWAARRHAQVRTGELIFMARNMDFLTRRAAG